jgi:AcrR family transcriptional regulator
MSLWERNKERRRKQILEAAAELLAREGPDGLSMRKLAREAEVSVATLYNVCGTREEIIWAVVIARFGRLYEVLQDVPESRPIERMHAVISATARHFEADARLSRAVMLAAIEQGPGPGTPVLFVAAVFSEDIGRAIAAGTLRNDLDPEVLSAHVTRAYLHGMLSWSRGFMSSDSFEATVLYSLYESLLGVATDAVRPEILQQIHAVEPKILELHRRMFASQNSAETGTDS